MYMSWQQGKPSNVSSSVIVTRGLVNGTCVLPLRVKASTLKAPLEVTR